jgi:hypothetical protein
VWVRADAVSPSVITEANATAVATTRPVTDRFMVTAPLEGSAAAASRAADGPIDRDRLQVRRKRHAVRAA